MCIINVLGLYSTSVPEGNIPEFNCGWCFAEIVDGNVKMTLGMIWTIILRFAIQDISVEGVYQWRRDIIQRACRKLQVWN